MITNRAARVVIENWSRARGTAAAGYYATIPVHDPAHIDVVQWTTSDYCRVLGFDESGRLDAVRAVTELVRAELIAPRRRGELRLSAVRKWGRLALEARVGIA